MHSRRTLLVLGAIAAACIAMVVAGGQSRDTVQTSRRIVPELASGDDIARIQWRHPGQAPFQLVRGDTGALSLHASPAGRGLIPDLAALDDILATLELLSPVRTLADKDLAAGGKLQGHVLTLELELISGKQITLRLGERIPAIDRAWLERDGRLLVIAGYAARALDRQLADLRERRIVRLPGERITAVEIHAGERELVLSGQPPQVHAGPLGGHVRVDPGLYAELARVLGALVVTRFVAGDETGDQAEDEAGDTPSVTGALGSVRVLGGGEPAWLAVSGPCPGDDTAVLAATSLGSGCVARATVDAALAYARRRDDLYARDLLSGGAISEIAVASAPGGPETATLRLVARGRAWSLGDQPAEARAVEDWLQAMRKSTSGRHVAANDVAGRAISQAIITVSYASGESDRIEFARSRRFGLLARRGDEPIYWLIDVEPHAGEIFPAVPVRFRLRQILTLEPMALREAILRRGGAVLAHVVRGQLLEDWSAKVPAGRQPRPAVIAALRELARLRALELLADEPQPDHGLTPPRRRIELVFDPGPLEDVTTRHVLALGRATERGCYARLDTEPAVFTIDRAECEIFLGSWVDLSGE